MIRLTASYRLWTLQPEAGFACMEQGMDQTGFRTLNHSAVQELYLNSTPSRPWQYAQLSS